MTTRSSFVRTVVAASVFVFASSAILPAAQPQAAAQQAAAKDPLPTVPVRIDVVLTRLQGEKKISSLPFSLLANATDARTGSGRVSMRMGVDVPIGTSTSTNNVNTPTAPNGSSVATGTTSTKVEYRNVGTNIDCWTTRLDESHYRVEVSVNDSSIYAPDGDGKAFKSAEPTAFRTFNTSNAVAMQDGQAVLFGVGTDKISGETLKVEVTLHVVK